MTTASNKAKARALQQRVRDFLLALYPELAPSDVVSCPMGSSGVDVQLSAAARRLIPFDIECKARQSIAIYRWLEQRKGDKHPMLVLKADRKEPLVVLFEADFIDLLRRVKTP